MQKAFLILVMLVTGSKIFAQRTKAACACDTQKNISITGSIINSGEQVFKNNFKKYKYNSNITFTNTSDCTLEVIAATIDGKTVFVAKRITTTGTKKELWQKEIISTRPLGSNGDSVKVLIMYRLNTIPCKQEFTIPVTKQ